MTIVPRVWPRRAGVLLFVLLFVVAGCTQQAPARRSGALVSTRAKSTVGVLLDEIPVSLRARATASLLAKPTVFWTNRAKTQLRLTTYRLVFRNAYYTGKQELPLPPEKLWEIRLTGAPHRANFRGHDAVFVDYTFSSVLLTDAASPGISEPRLSTVGGKWDEPFVLPLDPELVLQRTGYACIDETEFPFPSVDSEEVDSFYDQECDVESGLGNKDQCHYTRPATQSCVAALDEHVGRVTTAVTFERLSWDATLADRYRYGPVTGDDPDLAPYRADFVGSRVVYKYVHPTSCELGEHAVGATGWRRVLEFSTSDENVGNEPLIIGGVDYGITGHPAELDAHNLFEYSRCHNHYHFKYYGSFQWKGSGSSRNYKKGFCLQSTERSANREGSPLHEPFASCDNQGVAAGWVDQYKAGIPSQFLDITDMQPGKGTRRFTSNPLGLLCEGKFTDAKGAPLGAHQKVVWTKTKLIADNGKPVEAPRCRLKRGWQKNNTEEIATVIPQPGEGLITTPCTRGQIGPLRNCGFRKTSMIVNCKAGQPTTAVFSIPTSASPQVVRVTDYSQTLKTPIPARYEDSWVPLKPGVSDQPYLLANSVVMPGAPRTMTFPCPSPRSGGSLEPGGAYGVYTAPVLPGDPPAEVART